MEKSKEQLAEDFAIKIISVVRTLQNDFIARPLCKQLLRSVTSIGANFAEAKYAESDLDLIHKLSISQKEASETLYWLRTMHRSHIIGDDIFEELYNEGYKIIKIISRIIIKIKSRI